MNKHKLMKTVNIFIIGLCGVPLLQYLITPNYNYSTAINVYTLSQLHFPLFGIFIFLVRWIFIINFFISIFYSILFNKKNEMSKSLDDTISPFYLRN